MQKVMGRVLAFNQDDFQTMVFKAGRVPSDHVVLYSDPLQCDVEWLVDDQDADEFCRVLRTFGLIDVRAVPTGRTK